MLVKRNLQVPIAVAFLIGLWLTMLMNGTGPVDRAVLDFLYAADRPALRSASLFVTLFGEWQTVIAVSVVVAIFLVWQRHVRGALLLLAITLIGRTLVHMQKLAIGRLRPDAQEHLVEVKSLSFPSAHSANSMILFLSVALIASPKEWRKVTVPLAIAGAILVGVSRPMLGVHWPSDVLGGWSFGAAWVLVMMALSERWPARKGLSAKR